MSKKPKKAPAICTKIMGGKSTKPMVKLKPKLIQDKFFSGKFFKNKKEREKGTTKIKAPKEAKKKDCSFGQFISV